MIWFIAGCVLFGVILTSTGKSLVKDLKRQKEDRRIYGYVRGTGDDWDVGGWILMNLLVSILIAIAVLVCNITSAAAIWNFAPDSHEYYVKNDFEIVAMQDNLNTNGRFYLTHGMIETDLYYFYMRETSRGLKQGKMPANNTYITYTEDTPHVEYYETRFKEDVKWVDLFTLNDRCYVESYYRAYVPTGTVQEDFYVDLK